MKRKPLTASRKSWAIVIRLDGEHQGFTGRYFYDWAAKHPAADDRRTMLFSTRQAARAARAGLWNPERHHVVRVAVTVSECHA